MSARRPSVSTGLSLLARQGLVERVNGEWLPPGDPPGELLELPSIHVAADDEPSSDSR